MALTTTPYLDTFDTEIATHFTQKGDWSVVAGRAVAGATPDATTSAYELLHDALETDHHAQAAFNFKGLDGSARILVRAADNLNYYSVEGLSGGLIRLHRITNGSSVQILSQNGAIPSDGDFFLSARVIGDQLTVRTGAATLATQTIPAGQFLTNTLVGVRVAVAGIEVDDFRLASPDAGVTSISSAGGTAFPTGAVTSTLVIATANNLPASGSVQYYVHKVSDKTVFAEGLAVFTNGAASIDLDTTDFPVGTEVDWQVINPTALLEAGSRQVTE